MTRKLGDVDRGHQVRQEEYLGVRCIFPDGTCAI